MRRAGEGADCLLGYWRAEADELHPCGGRRTVARRFPAVGCTEGRTEGRGTLPVGPQLLTLQLASWGLLKYHGQSAEPLLSLCSWGIFPG